MGDFRSASSSQPPPRPSPVPAGAAAHARAVPAAREEPEHAGDVGDREGSVVRPSPAHGVSRERSGERPSVPDVDVDVDVDVRSALSAPRLPEDLAAEVARGSGGAPRKQLGSGAPPRREDSIISEPPPGASWRPRESLPVLARYGRFELLGRLARGGMAEILLARERSFGDAMRHVVVKRILPQAAEDAEYVKMFLAEGRLMMGLSHPNVCHVYDVGQQGNTWFIAMEWVHGQPMSKLIRRARELGRRLPPPLVAKMTADVAAALHHAHNAKDASGKRIGLVHRDVSPHNVMVAYDGSTKLLDFGIAKITSNPDHTTTGVVKGKFAYMAPEQCLGRELDARADVFALGICLYEALTGRSLYRRGNDYETLRAVIKEPVPSIRDIDPTLPEALDAIVQKALQKRPGDRFESALAMQLSLERYITSEQHLVNSALVGRLMRRMFADEIREGPGISPIVVQPDVDELPEGAPLAAVADAPPDPGSAPSEPSASPLTGGSDVVRGRGRGLGMGLALVLAVGAVAAYLGLGTDVLEIAPATSAPPAEDHRAPTDDDMPAAGARDEGTPTAPVEEAAAMAGDEEPGASVETEDGEAASEGAAAADEDAAAEAERRAAAEERRDRRRRERARAAAAQAEPASLSLNTRPWSRVYVGNRLLGTTPIGAASVPSGVVRLRFEDRDGHVHQKTIRLEPGQRAERFFDLTR